MNIKEWASALVCGALGAVAFYLFVLFMFSLGE